MTQSKKNGQEMMSDGTSMVTSIKNFGAHTRGESPFANKSLIKTNR
jgi:hypothetical protein